jgi:putative ABC transport system substrate-binding protein
MAQAPGRVYRVAMFDFFPVSAQHPSAVAFFGELRRRGYVAGQNLVIDRRDAGGDLERLAIVAREIVATKPDLVISSSTGPNLAIKAATSTIPLLMAPVADPVQLGLVESLARPGGNITGLTAVVPGGFAGKMLQLLHETVPAAKRIAALINPNNGGNQVILAQEAPQAAQRLGLELRTYEVKSRPEIEPALDAARRDHCHAVWVWGDPVLNPAPLGPLVTGAGMPLMSFIHGHTRAGGLMSYGPDLVDVFRRAGILADRLLKGANPAEIAIEQPSKFDLVINLGAAATLGLTIPGSVRLRADEVIE